MGELRELLEHADFEELVTLLLYGPDTENRDMDNYEKGIENGYTDAFAQVEKILADEEPDRMDRIRSVFYDLATIHDDIYFKAGTLFGFQLYRSLDQKYL